MQSSMGLELPVTADTHVHLHPEPADIRAKAPAVPY